MKRKKILQTRAPAGVPASGQKHSPQRILVVDDDPFCCHRNAEVLIQHGFQVNAAEDGQTGWEELQVNQYNLLIIENELPKLTGIALVKKLRSARMALPVIMATEKPSKSPATKSLWLHPVITLLKPYTVAEFLQAVEVVLGARNIADGKIASPSLLPPAAGG